MERQHFFARETLSFPLDPFLNASSIMMLGGRDLIALALAAAAITRTPPRSGYINNRVRKEIKIRTVWMPSGKKLQPLGHKSAMLALEVFEG